MKKYLIILALSLCIAFESFAQFSGFPGISGFPSIGSSENVLNSANTKKSENKIGFGLIGGFSTYFDDSEGYVLGLELRYKDFRIGYFLEEFYVSQTWRNYSDGFIDHCKMLSYLDIIKLGYVLSSNDLFEISANGLIGNAISEIDEREMYHEHDYSVDESLIGAGIDCTVYLLKFLGFRLSFNATNVGFIMDTTAVIKF